MTIENFETVFFKRQKSLFDALKRQRQLFEKYCKDLNNWDDLHNWDFNLLHDLEYRIEERINELQSEYYDLHFQKYQFNAY